MAELEGALTGILLNLK